MGKKLLKVSGIIVAVVAILLATAALLLNSDAAQNWLMQRAVGMLKEELQTEVSVGHVSVSLLKGSVTLSDVEVEDRQHRKMLGIGKLSAALDLGALWRHEVVVTNAHISGVKAQLCKPASPTDSVANYQFLVDALKGHKTHKPHEAHDTLKTKKPIALRIATATIDVDSLRYTTDNGRPRRNTGKPHHGAFDAGHLDICTAMKVTIHSYDTNNANTFQERKPSLNCAVEVRNLTDRIAGIQVDTLLLQADICKDSLQLSDVSIRLPHTSLSFAEGVVVLPDTTTGRKLHYYVPQLSAITQIRDIAQPFAPVLKNFTTPLKVKCAFSGDADGMDFKGVEVATTDNRLNIKATGNIRQLRDKNRLHIHFDVGQMNAQRGMPERIINHFAVKKFMMKQLRALGNIGYKGHFDVVPKKESFAGRLRTQHGAIDFRFALDELNKYVSGTASTNALKLGRIMDMKDLGRIACHANFRFDISKPRTAKMRRLKGGKLPIGNIDAEVHECHWKFVAVHNVSATISSDGAEADGKIINRGNFIDLTCKFSFTNTDQMHKLKVKPGIKIHGKKKKNKDTKK